MPEEAPTGGASGRVEDAARAGALRALGLALLAGFALPVLGPQGYFFPNAQLLLKGGCSGGVAALLIYPAFAGVVAILLAGFAHPARSVVLLVLGVGALALPFTDAESRGELLRAADLHATWGTALAVAGIGGILTGALANAARPASRIALCVAGLGGLCYLGGLAAPFALGRPQRSAVLMAVNRLRNPGGFGVGFALSLGIALVCVASLVCVANLIRWRATRGLAQVTLGLLVAAMALGAAARAAPALAPLLRSGRPGLWAAFALALAASKYVLWFGGLILLAPAGAADLITNLARPPAVVPGTAPGSGGATGPPTPSAIDRLTELQSMREQGLITDNEFETKRRRIVDEI